MLDTDTWCGLGKAIPGMLELRQMSSLECIPPVTCDSGEGERRGEQWSR